jgi:hypothetical protein
MTTTRGWKAAFAGSKASPTSVTSPTCRPKSVTGAPTDKPRTDSLKWSTKRRRIPSGAFIAVARSG